MQGALDTSTAGSAARGQSLPALDQCELTPDRCAALDACPAVQLCASVPLVSEMELDRSAWTGRCVSQCTAGVDDEFGCNWQPSTCPQGYKCVPCNELK